MGSRAILLIEKNVDPAHENEFNAWYSTDHMPLLLRCPGFIRGRRFVASSTYYPASTASLARTGRKYVQIYELDSVEALNTDEYRDIATIHPTTWTQKMRPHLRDIVRDIFVELPEPTADQWIGREASGLAAGQAERPVLHDQAGPTAAGDAAIPPTVVGMEVTRTDTATAFRSGDLDVLATPRLIALLEEAAVAACARLLEPGQASVGVRIEFDHIAPSFVGDRVEAHATVMTTSTRAITVRVEGIDAASRRVIGRGTHVRAIVDRDGFMRRLEQDQAGSSRLVDRS